MFLHLQACVNVQRYEMWAETTWKPIRLKSS